MHTIKICIWPGRVIWLYIRYYICTGEHKYTALIQTEDIPAYTSAIYLLSKLEEVKFDNLLEYIRYPKVRYLSFKEVSTCILFKL